MAKKPNTVLLGIFVVAGSAIAIAAIALFGSGKFFKNPDRYVIFFPESVQGLSIGAPVEFRGVRIGSVADIQAIFRNETNKIIISVYIDIEPNRIKNIVPQPRTVEEKQANLIKAGFRAQLITLSIVTGQRAVAVDFYPQSELRLVGADPSVPEISSVPSSLERISSKLESLPVEDIARKLERTLTAIESAVSSPDFSNGLKAIGPSLEETRLLVSTLSREVPALIRDARMKVDGINTSKIASEFERTLLSLNRATENIEEFSRKDSAFSRNSNRALEEIAAAARELRQLAELLQRRPEALLAGKK